ncbi:bacitracin ABC transporter [Lactobacillus delbrueckii subsp. bulgaricus]|uniref:Bacitracin ABC transporter n=1 Tax=Lactobacillus delbrueckii subsp. lactis TaxID=29397 RepID=A0A3G6JG02_LACDL|nr:MAG: bacitracin ABC transporter [Lactobacillus delbrueckii subsp. lactis]TLQ32094.1 bacitracin ABC transporter [Lactobacillus delbrueckii subsp. bulgaricus]AZA24519.1 MAG: bacitracin ABC transporter [Lactobacillus delbrueckii subsp. lactis]MCT3483530.1 bacitracin ABC transporter [Lactobacillus delbrueckii subsp. lactis]MCT3502014.1 bacitracin ABC transporter [Lactobacillus delbrueckii subsp. lactis]
MFNLFLQLANYIKTDDGTELLEFKCQRIRRTILVDDFLNEVMQARKDSYTTEQ